MSVILAPLPSACQSVPILQAGASGAEANYPPVFSPIQTIARLPVQQHESGLKTAADELPQANFFEQYWQMGQDPAG